jgi:FkbM family methyltransferase
VRTDAEARLRVPAVSKEPWTVAWLEDRLRERDVLYDVGANVGVYSLLAAKAAPGPISVLAFEPAPANYAALCENVVLNRAQSLITPLPLVLGESTRTGVLELVDLVAGSGLHRLDGGIPAAFRQPVLVFALDDLLDRFPLPPPTLLKLDVDGSEAAVLAGARRTLADPLLRSAIVEVEVRLSDAVLRELRAAGLELVARFDERDGVPLPGIWYGIFDRVERWRSVASSPGGGICSSSVQGA